MSEVTRILSAIQQGDTHAVDELLPHVYRELRRLAARQMAGEKPGQTLTATALVHEAYLRLVGREEPRPFRDRGHFFAAAATAMRRILIDNARRHRAKKRGGALTRRQIPDVPAEEPDENLLALDRALEKLAVRDLVKAKLVELRYFGGLTGEQAAEVLGISPTTADRHWAYARAWLKAEIERG